MNPTMAKFGYPETLIHEYKNWVLLLRPQQVTLGALVLICKNTASSFSEINSAAFLELKEVTQAIEGHLKDLFSYDKINYLMLMMVDPDVHFHVLPRYAETRVFNQYEFKDHGWPGPPDLSQDNQVAEPTKEEILKSLQKVFAANR